MSVISKTHDEIPRSVRRGRLQRLKNVRPFLSLFWETGPLLVVIYFILRLLRAAIPVVTLYITKLVIDTVVRSVQTGTINTARLWQLVIIELILAVISDALGR